METENSRLPTPDQEKKSEMSTLLKGANVKSIKLNDIDRKTELLASKRETTELISNFSVASLLAGTKTSSPRPTLWTPTDFYANALQDPSNVLSGHDSNLSPSLKPYDCGDTLMPINGSDLYLMDRILDARPRSHAPHSRFLSPHHSRLPQQIQPVWTAAGPHVVSQRPLVQGSPATGSQWAAAISLQAAGARGSEGTSP
ncbi:hypothetical protein X975_04594, partial [Stegodyphus mimosarum]